MFKVNDKVLDKNGMVFSIESVIEKDFGDGPVSYFVLDPCFDYDFGQGYKSYIPVSKSDSLLRPVLDKEEALALIDQFPKLETYENVSPRERKTFFVKIISNGNRTDICKIIKTLVNYRKQRESINKPFSDYDRRLLISLTSLLCNEMSMALDMIPSDVIPFINSRTGLGI